MIDRFAAPGAIAGLEDHPAVWNWLRKLANVIGLVPHQSMGSPAKSVVGLMKRFQGGDRDAAGELFELFYPRLKQIAAGQMRLERSSHTLQPTALVNELYLELVKGGRCAVPIRRTIARRS